MALTQNQITAVKDKAAGKNVVVYLGDGDTITGTLVNITSDHVQVDLNGEVSYIDIVFVKALRILK